MAPYVDEFPTERTEMRMTAFMMEGTTLMPAFWTAMTNGDALISVENSLLRRRSSV